MFSYKKTYQAFLWAATGFVLIVGYMIGLGQAATATKGIGIKIKAPDGQPIDLYTGSYALVIGVADYTAGWPDLESVPAETEKVRRALLDHQFDVTMSINPKSDQLRDAFRSFINAHGFDSENRLFFFFSGHGHSRNNGTKGYLVPADAPDPRRDKVGFLRKAIEMSQVLEWSRRIEAKHALFVFDSCFSGTVFKTKALPEIPPHISRFTARPVRQFISAGSAGEEIPAKSVFVPTFVRALRGEGDLNRDSYVTGTELGMYLQQKVLSYRIGQTPQYGKIRDPELDEGDIVFALKTPPEADQSDRKAASASMPDVEKPPAVQSVNRKPQAEVPPKRHIPDSISASAVEEKTKYIAHANGIVFDPKTKLEWVVGPDRDTSFIEAKNWAEKLSLDGGGWRLPTRSELRALYSRQGWFSTSLPQWVTFSGAGIWSSHIRSKISGGTDYYYLFSGVEYTSNGSAGDVFGKRALSVRHQADK